MGEEFAPYQQSVDMKELGFDEACFSVYQPEMDGKYYLFSINVDDIGSNNSDNVEYIACTAPTYSQAFRFFREKYSWQHSIDATSDQHSFELGYNYWIWNYKTGEEYHTMPKNRPSGDWEYKTYEEAELECLKKLIEICCKLK
jgi:hypothetical protein